MIVHTYSETMTMYPIKLQGPTEWGRILEVIEVHGSAGLEHGSNRWSREVDLTFPESRAGAAESRDGEAS